MSIGFPDVSVIILNYNGQFWMHRCLESLRAQTIFERIEVVVADNLSTDGSDKLSQQLLDGWKNGLFIQNGANIGFGAGSNLAVQRARGKYLFFLNPDVWLEPDCLQRLFEAAEGAAVGVAGLLVMDYDDNTLQTRGSDFFDICGHAVAPRPASAPRELFAACGFYFIRTDLFRQLGGFDQQFFLYGEECDLSWRVWISGERIIHVPEARMHHRGSASVNPKGGTKIVEHRTSDLKRFYANRNHLLTLCKNCRHVLLLMLVPCLLLLLLETLVGAALLRRWSFIQETFVKPIRDCWRLRGHIAAERKRISAFRKRSDFYMLRFLTWRFSRWLEVMRVVRMGLPIVEARQKPAAQRRAA